MPAPRAYDRLLHELCVKHGHCGSESYVDQLLSASGVITSLEFAALMLESEEMTKEAYGSQYEDNLKLISTKFEEHVGSNSIDVALLKR